MNNQLVEAANLQTFRPVAGLPPADYVMQEMASRGGGFDAAFLRENHARVIAAQSVNGLALVVLLRVLDKADPEQTGFPTIAYDLTGTQIFRSGTDEGSKLPKSTKTGYREYGEVASHLAADTGLVVNAITRERDAAAERAQYLESLLASVPDTAANAANEASSDAPRQAAPPARVKRAQGARREA